MSVESKDLMALIKAALSYEKRMSLIANVPVYKTGEAHPYWALLERRNEIITQAARLCRQLGRTVDIPRIHERNVDKYYVNILDFVNQREKRVRRVG